MEDKYIQLIEKYFDNSLTPEEKTEFNNLLSADIDFKKAFEEQKKVKEVFSTMKLKTPAKELWDGYWLSTYNRIERGIAWIAIFIGALFIIGYSSVVFVESLYNTGAPVWIKFGTITLVFGLLVLLFSVFREKIFTYKNDKYKEIKR